MPVLSRLRFSSKRYFRGAVCLFPANTLTADHSSTCNHVLWSFTQVERNLHDAMGVARNITYCLNTILILSNSNLFTQVERNLHDAMGVARNITISPSLVPGGGAVEMAISRALAGAGPSPACGCSCACACLLAACQRCLARCPLM